MSEPLQKLIQKGERAMRSGDILVALVQFEAAYAIEPLPAIKSKLAYCLALERRQLQKSLALCKEAIKAEPANADHYYQLGRVYLIAKQKRHAIAAMRKGLKYQRHQPIIDELTKIGVRKDPVFASLPREHFLNRSCGRLLDQLGTR